MPHYRAQITTPTDAGLPRDVMTIDPCFHDAGVTSDPAGLADELAASVAAWITTAPTVTVKLYDIEGTKPVYPAAQKTVNPGNNLPTTGPREIALCLSFYAGQNRKRYRGRVYIPFSWVARTSGLTVIGSRPSAAQITKVLSFRTVLQDLGGPDVDWEVWSGVDRTGRSVSDCWVDDEWDIQRRRGSRPTTRQIASPSE